MDDYKFEPDQADLPRNCEFPREMSPAEMVLNLGNGIRELMLIERRREEDDVGFRLGLSLGAVDVAVVDTSLDVDGFNEDLAHSIAGAGRMIDRMGRLLQDVLTIADNHYTAWDECPDCKSTIAEIRELLKADK